MGDVEKAVADRALGGGADDVVKGGDQGEVLLDAVVRFQLEPPPIGPDEGAGTVIPEVIPDLVAFHGMFEGGDVKAELVGDVHGRDHLVGPVDVPVDEEIPTQDGGQRLELKIPGGPLLILSTLLLVAITLSTTPLLQRHLTTAPPMTPAPITPTVSPITQHQVYRVNTHRSVR